MPIRVSSNIKWTLVSDEFGIKAAADKLKRELEEFGFPPNFPPEAKEDAEEEKAATPKENENKVDNKSKSKKVTYLNCTSHPYRHLFRLFS